MKTSSYEPITAIEVSGELDDDSIFRTYLMEISKYPLLTAEKEKEFSAKIAEGDKDARSKLVTSNLRLVVYWANKYSDSRMHVNDLIQFGNVGLLKAVDKYDVSKGTRFGTYASFWIKMAILRGKYSTGPVIRLPDYVVNDAIKLAHIEEKLETELSREPKINELAEKSGFSEEKVSKLKNMKFSVLSLDQPVKDDEGNSATIIDFIPAGKEWEPDYVADEKFRHEDIMRALDTLPDRMREVVIMRFGLLGGQPLTLEQAGDKLGLTRERVRQIEKAALRRLSRSKDILAYAS